MRFNSRAALRIVRVDSWFAFSAIFVRRNSRFRLPEEAGDQRAKPLPASDQFVQRLPSTPKIEALKFFVRVPSWGEAVQILANAKLPIAKISRGVIAGWALTAAGFAFLSIPAVLAYRFYEWLRYGAWPSITAADIFRMAQVQIPQAQWAGIQKTIDWVAASEIEWVALAATLALGFISARIAGE